MSEGEARAAEAAAEGERELQARFQARFRELQEKADAGLPEAMHLVGIAWARGKGVPQDYAKAVAYFKRAAAMGHVKAQVSLGYCHATGKGVPRDLEKAYVLLREAADLGDREGFELAERVAQRLHVEQLRRCDELIRRRKVLRRVRQQKAAGNAPAKTEPAGPALEIEVDAD